MFIIKIERFRERLGSVPYFSVSARDYKVHHSILHYKVAFHDGFSELELAEGDTVYVMNAGSGNTVDKYIVDTRA